jgi:hypothetical protein
MFPFELTVQPRSVQPVSWEKSVIRFDTVPLTGECAIEYITRQCLAGYDQRGIVVCALFDSLLFIAIGSPEQGRYKTHSSLLERMLGKAEFQSQPRWRAGASFVMPHIGPIRFDATSRIGDLPPAAATAIYFYIHEMFNYAFNQL